MPRLFSYGSLQQREVQMAAFGRALPGEKDELPGFELRVACHADKQLANVVRCERSGTRVSGMVFEISEQELLAADAYERADGYARIAVPLASGVDAWMYVDSASLS
jgi:gamma-glutamylcyclotransferase (GGCT)/AIG2-like uncharacterized protein YtfP